MKRFITRKDESKLTPPIGKLYQGAHHLLLLVFTTMLVWSAGFAQSPVFFSSGNYAAPNNWAQGSAFAMGTIVGTNIHTTTPNGSGFQYFRFYSALSGGTIYEPNGGADILLNNSTAAGLQVTGSGKAYYLNIVNASSVVVFKTNGGGAPGSSTVVAFEVQGPIRTVASVTQLPLAGQVVAGQAVNITANLSGSLSTGQNVYLRYTNNGYATSTVVPMSGAGTVYSATIPAAFNTTANPNISYYVFTSGPSNVASNGSNADLFTINLNNNGGPNYSYTVLAANVSVTSSLLPANDAFYNTLKAAFDQINIGTHQGAINVNIIGNTTETASAVLNASGTGGSSYTGIVIQPSGGAARTVTGNFGAALIDLNDADNVSIDGLNAGGNALTISNASTTGAAIRFRGAGAAGASNNLVQNCTIEGSVTSGSDGVITFGAGTNPNNTITNNIIKEAGSNLPSIAIISAGTANNGNVVTGNAIQNFFNPNGNSSGININAGSSAWVITSNRFFQTASRTLASGPFTNTAIQISTGGGYIINNNVIGFANSAGTGTTTFSGGLIRFVGIEHSTSSTILSNIQGNTISGISLTTTSAPTLLPGIFTAIYIVGGNVNVGTTSGNIIGAAAGNGAITLTQNTTGASTMVAGIYAATANTVTIQNNTIGSINLVSFAAAAQYNFNGIYGAGTNGNLTINDNLVGSTTTSNSIQVGVSGTNATNFTGIRNDATGTVSIVNNTIQNCAQIGTGGTFNGINNVGGTGTVNITDNRLIAVSKAGTGTFTGITNAAAASILNLNNNVLRNISISSVSGNSIYIGNTGAVTSIININNNQLGNASGGLVTYTGTHLGTFNAISNTGGTVAATLNVQSNDLRGITYNTSVGTAQTFILNSASTLSQNISSNTFTNLSLFTTGNITFISNNVALSASGTQTINSNAIVTGFTTTNGGGIVTFYTTNTASAAGATSNQSNNNFSNITLAGGSTVNGWNNQDGGATRTIQGNTFSNITSGSGSITALSVGGGASSTISNNTISGLSTTNAITGMVISAGSHDVFSNTISGLTSTGGGNSVTGISNTTGTSNSIRQNTISGLASTAGSFSSVNAIAVSGGTTVLLSKNKIYDLSASGNGSSLFVNGIAISGGTTVTAQNNLIGDLRSPASTVVSGVNGINISSTATATYNIYYNSIYLNTTGGAGAGSSGIFHAGSAVATTATLDLRNNIIVNTSTPGAGGFTVAHRRTNANLANYSTNSNRNSFYAGVPSASNLIYYDGANSDQTLAAYQTRVATRDNASISVLANFLSTAGASANFLHINASLPTAIDGGAGPIGSITDDFDGDTRNATTPDIGADEFTGISCGAAPVLTSIATAAPYYAGDVITVNGTGLAGITIASINGVSATVGTVTATTAQLTVPAGITTLSGNILVSTSSSCPSSNNLAFTFSGYITKGGGAGSGNWSVNTIWRNNLLPTANAPVTINNGDAVGLNVSADPSSITINATATLTHQTNGLTLGATNLLLTTVNGTLTIDNAAVPVVSNTNSFRSTTVTVASGGVFNNNSLSAAAVNIVNFNVNNGATYNHNATGSSVTGAVADFPGSSTRSFGATSNVVITRWANGGTPVALPASGSPGWGNLTINIQNVFGGNWNQTGLLTAVQGNLNIQATGSGTREMILSSATATTTAVAGSVTVSGGIFTVNSGGGNVYAMNVGGDLVVSNSATFKPNTGSGTGTNVSVTVSGAVTVGGTAAQITNGSGTATVTLNCNIFNVNTGGTYSPASNTGTLPTTNVTGAMIVAGGDVATSFGTTYTYNLGSLTVSAGTFGMSTSSSTILQVTTGSLTISGTGSMASTSSGNVTVSVTNDFVQSSSSSSAFVMQASTSAGRTYTLNIGGNFQISNGTFIGGSNSSIGNINFTGGAASVTYTQSGGAIVCTGNSGKTNVNVKSGKTLTLATNFNPGSTANTNNWSLLVESGGILQCGNTSQVGVANSWTGFTVFSGGTLRTGNTAGVLGSITTLAGNTVLSDGATYEFNGTAGAQVTSAFVTSPAATPSNTANIIINNSAGVSLSASYNVTATLQLQTGRLTLGTFNLTSASVTGAPYSSTKMVVTDNTGALGLPVSIGTILFPVGNGTAYTPASYTFSANSTARYLNVRAVTPRNVNDISATDYINNRWWNTDLSVTTGTYTYTSSYTYITGDLVGTAANIRLNRWNGSTWINDASSSVNTGTLTINSGTLNETTGALAATAQWVGRVFVAPAVYRWTNTVNGSWLDATKWTPVGVPGSGDGVIFDAAGGATYTVTNMPVGINLTQFTVSNNNNFTLSAGASGTVGVVFPGTATPQFRINAGSSMTLAGTNVVNLNLPANCTGSVTGTLALQQAAHTITAVTAGALVFGSGGYFAEGSLGNPGFSGSPFGSTSTAGSVIFQNGSVLEAFEGANPFGSTSVVTFQTGSLYKYSNPNTITPGLSTSGRTYANFEYNAGVTLNAAAAASAFVCDNLTATSGTLNFSLQGTPGHAVRGNISVAAGAGLSFTPAVAGTVLINSGTTQTISGAGIFTVGPLTTLNIVNGTTVSLQKDMSVTGTGNLTVNGTLICTGENSISSTGTVALTSTGTLSIQSANGIQTGGTLGNIRTSTFTSAIGSVFIYSGTTNQVTGNRLPATLTSPSVLTIANTGIAPNNIVTLTTNNTTVPRINLNAGRFNAGTGGTLVISAGGIVSGGGGNQLLSGTANDNIIRFAANGAVQGTPELYNVTLGTSGGGVDFTNNARINGTLLINPSGSVNPNAPRYATGSTLVYNTGGGFIRNIEWGNTVPGAAGYPHHVVIRGGTTLSFTGTTLPGVGCSGDVSIGNPSGADAGVLDLSAVGLISINIAGNLNIGSNTASGTLTMSNTIGGDLNLGGNWTRTANGVVNFGAGLGRAIFFVGANDASITANNGQQFPFMYLNKSAKAAKLTLVDNVSISDEVSFVQGTLDLGTNNKFFTLISTATKTARVGQSSAVNTDFIYGSSDKVGQFVVQRYVPARRSWRLVAAPLKPTGGSHSISEAWQERGTPLLGLNYSTAAATVASIATDSIPAGFGTQITGGTAANGFDQSLNNGSGIKYYSAGSWLTPTNINNTSVNSREGWMLFVRGDRKNFGQITTQYKTPTTTTLRPRGQIFIGSKSIISSGTTVVGNPYASAVDYNAVTRTGAGWPANPTYYMWDPYLGGATGQGAFVTLTWNGTDFTRSVPSTIDNRYIPSGAAIMVDFPAGGGTLTFNESNKNSNNTTTAFRPTASQQLMTVLRTVNADRSTYVSDGALALFGKDFNNDADENDALKMGNFAENFGLLRGGKVYSIERRNLIDDADTLLYNIAKMQAKKYQLQFIMSNIDAAPGTVAFVEDTYLQKKTPVSLADTTTIDFSIATNAEAQPGRFRLVFRKSARFIRVEANARDNDIAVRWDLADEFDLKHFVIQRSLNGLSFADVATVKSNGNSEVPVNYQWLDASPAPGEYYYRVQSVSNAGVVMYSDVVKVKIVKGSPELYVFPNPVQQNTIQLQFNKRIAGNYNVRMFNSTGQQVVNSLVVHAGGTAMHQLTPTTVTVLPEGVYQLEITTPEKKKQTIKVMVGAN